MAKNPITNLANFGDLSADMTKAVITSMGKQSLARMAKESIFQFPVIISSSIDTDEIGVLNKAIEQTYASMIVSVMSLEGSIDRKKYPDVVDYLRKFHTNSDLKPGLIPGGLMTMESATISCVNTYNNASLMESLWDITEEQVDMESINDIYSPFRSSKRKMYDALTSMEVATEAKNPWFSGHPNASKFKKGLVGNAKGEGIGEFDPPSKPTGPDVFDPRNKNVTSSSNTTVTVTDGEKKGEKIITTTTTWKDSEGNTNVTVKKEKETLEYDEKKKKNVTKKELISETTDTNTVKDDSRKESKLMSGNGQVVKSSERLNNMEPTLVNITFVNYNDSARWTQNVTLGIKAMTRLVKSSAMIANMIEAGKDRAIFRFISWTKGEYKLHNFLGQIAGLKDAKDAGIGVARKSWIKTLKHRKKVNNLYKLIGYRLLPNCTIIMTDAEAEQIKASTGIDFRSASVARKVINKYFLLGLGIYDTESKVLDMIYESDTAYTSYPYRALVSSIKKDIILSANNKY